MPFGRHFIYRVSYYTPGVHGDTTLVSGLVALPITRDILGVVSWQHGTTTYRPYSVSTPDTEGIGVAGMFAGAGFLLVAADYIGLGVSTEVHPYYHWPSTVSTVVDMIEIGAIMYEGISDNPDRDLFLAGFSQGGGATAALQTRLSGKAIRPAST